VAYGVYSRIGLVNGRKDGQRWWVNERSGRHRNRFTGSTAGVHAGRGPAVRDSIRLCSLLLRFERQGIAYMRCDEFAGRDSQWERILWKDDRAGISAAAGIIWIGMTDDVFVGTRKEGRRLHTVCVMRKVHIIHERVTREDRCGREVESLLAWRRVTGTASIVE